MSITAALLQEIQNEIEGVKAVRSIGMSFESFQMEFSRLLGQMEIDREHLLKAGMDEALIKKGSAYLYLLTEIQAERQVAEGSRSLVSQEFDALFPVIMEYHQLLFDLIAFIAEELDDPSIIHRRNKGIEGKSKINRIQAVISFIPFVRAELAIASRIRFNGVAVDESLLQRIEHDTHHILDLHTHTILTTSDRSLVVRKKKQLFSLCMRFRRKVRLYARAAFIMDRSYFKEHYRNKVYQVQYRSRKRAQ